MAEAIAAATGCADPAGSLLTVINEVTEGNWGNGGHPISLESIARTVGLEGGPRPRWSHAFFEAKARAMAAAGYPADTGGILPSLREQLVQKAPAA